MAEAEAPVCPGSPALSVRSTRSTVSVAASEVRIIDRAGLSEHSFPIQFTCTRRIPAEWTPAYGGLASTPGPDARGTRSTEQDGTAVCCAEFLLDCRVWAESGDACATALSPVEHNCLGACSCACLSWPHSTRSRAVALHRVCLACRTSASGYAMRGGDAAPRFLCMLMQVLSHGRSLRRPRRHPATRYLPPSPARASRSFRSSAWSC